MPRYQLCNPASWRIYDLEFFHVANQKLPLHSVSYLPESISQFLALDIYHFIASKALCEHEPASTNKNHSSASPYPVIVYQLLHFSEASLGSSFSCSSAGILKQNQNEGSCKFYVTAGKLKVFRSHFLPSLLIAKLFLKIWHKSFTSLFSGY